jgi:hypothetical protein
MLSAAGFVQVPGLPRLKIMHWMEPDFTKTLIAKNKL